MTHVEENFSEFYLFTVGWDKNNLPVVIWNIKMQQEAEISDVVSLLGTLQTRFSFGQALFCMECGQKSAFSTSLPSVAHFTSSKCLF